MSDRIRNARRASRLLVAAAAFTVLPVAQHAGAHAGHAAPIITIDRPAAGKLYVSDVEQAGSVGGAANTAISMGGTLTVTVSWKCPAAATGASVTVTVKDANGAAVDGYAGSFGSSGSRSWAWKGAASGTYTIEAKLECWCWDNSTRPPTRISHGGDTDTRNVVVIN